MRPIELVLSSGEELNVLHFHLAEAINASFRIQCVATGPDDLATAPAIGRAVRFALHQKRAERQWTGVVASIEQSGLGANGQAEYHVTVASPLWLLTRRTNHRTFLHQSAPEIATKLLSEWKIDHALRLAEKHPKLELRVQYGETDYDFMRRILAEAGISFFFESEAKAGMKLVLSDAPNASPNAHRQVAFERDVEEEPSADDERRHVHGITVSSKPFVPRVTLGDFDFTRPRHALTGKHAAHGEHHQLFEDYRFAPGHSLAASDEGPASRGATPMADAHGAYRHHDHRSHAHAQRIVDAARSASTRISFESTHADIAPGDVFAIEGHPHPELARGKRLLMTDAWITGSGEGLTAGGEAVPAEHPYRPSLAGTRASSSFGGDALEAPLDPTGPRIHGVQSAIVVGPHGEDVHTDEHGRVRVQFAWDREGRHDAKSSPWVRVTQASAGPGAGAVELPRVGDEVLVSFVGGHPEQPVVVGRLHNPASPTPYALPEHRTRSTFRGASRSGPGNEITFEDRSESEIFYVQAKRDLHKIVLQDELEHTLGDRHVSVEGDLILSATGRIILQSGNEIVVGGPEVRMQPPVAAPAAPVVPKKPAELATGAARRGKQSPAARANEALLRLDPGERSDARADAASRRALAEKYAPLATKLGEKHALPPALLLGWMSQESGLGADLRPDGYNKVDGYGYGLLQVDRRYHTPEGDAFGEGSVEQGIRVFRENLSAIEKAHPDWSREEHLAGALVAYNSGSASSAARPSTPEGWAALDAGTAPEKRYSRSVWAQAAWFAQNLKW